MSRYTKNMCKKVNQKENVQAYPYPSPKAGGAFKEETKSPQNSRSPANRGKGGGFSHKAAALPTDLHCYFQCPETFKKDYDLRLHLKLRHKNEHPDELRRAEEAAEEEICFVSRSGSKFQCAICQKMFTNDNTMYSHATKQHGMSWMDYKDKYGRCEVESAPFECKICGSVVKYTPNVVHSHLKQVHGLDWVKYLDRIRKLSRGEQPDELPQIERTECQICNSTVKYIKDHVWQVHKITEMEYQDRMDKVNRGLIPDELPSIETFICQICNVTVKGLREHVWNIHRLTESSYEERMEKINRGEDPGPLPGIELTQCKICSTSVKLFREHLKSAHKITRAEYEELFSE